MSNVIYHAASGYTVTIVSKNVATVFGGRLPKPVTIRRLLGDGDSNPKTAKNKVATRGLSLYPANGAGIGNVCPHAGVCVAPCLAHQGQGPVPSVMSSRVAKTVLWYLARDWFLAKLNRELSAFRASVPSGDVAGVRLNMFSDIPWEHFGVIDEHADIEFYDYTKNPRRSGQLRPNYWVTFSYDGTPESESHARRILETGGNVSAVFHNVDGKCGKAAHRQRLPQSFMGFPTINGTKTDWRPEDPRGVVVALPLLARTYASRNNAIESGFSTAAE
jgi:hypothetical protein